MKRCFKRISNLKCAVVAAMLCATPLVAADDAVDFNRDIQPILADTCYHCHGPDKSQRVSDFRLDRKEGAFDKEFGAIVPGDPQASELIRRITSTDPDVKMPPPDSERRLTAQQVRLLKQWIASGAEWQEHWSFVPPQASPIPVVKDRKWPRNPIDHFVLAALQSKDRSPSPVASKETLIRRLSLDLIGLPPTVEQVDEFLKDDSPDAYEKLVDRLLKSPRYGERMAVMWLDAARYADTSGYQNDGPRDMWRYRDWVIEAFNDNMPFDQFTIEQLAGDLLIQPPIDKSPADYLSAWRGELVVNHQHLQHLIPSAFHRNHRGNAEGGIIAEEYQVEYVVDRVDTTATVWLGLTLGCCRCHDHKYDPIQQKEFYEVFAFFNNVPEYGRAVKEGNSPPYIKAPTREQLKRWAVLEYETQKLRDTCQRALKSKQAIDAQQKWLARAAKTSDTFDDVAVVREGLLSRYTFDGDLRDARRPKAKTALSDQAVAVWGRGARRQAIRLDGQHHVDCGDFADFSYFDPFSVSAWVYPTKGTGTIISRMTPGAQRDGYYLHLEDGRLQFNLVKRWLDDSIRVATADKLPLNQWTHVTAVYDGSRDARGLQIFLRGKAVEVEIQQDFINQTFAAKEQPVRIGGGAANFHGKLDEVRIYDRAVSEGDAGVLADRRSIPELLESDVGRRSEKLQRYYLQHHAPQLLRNLLALRDEKQRERAEFEENLPTLMVMQEMKHPRTTHVLQRGVYDKPSDRVEPGVPDVLGPLPKGAPRNRLGLAKWLVSAENPLTARVIVNRVWQQHFGVGLVKTTEDFGVQGERPSHPELLDYLALRLIQDGWDLKALHRLIVTSATYRQSSRATQQQRAEDPENRYLSRGPRFRLPAEIVRDQALAVGGLLKHRLGGPSVFPYQPEGLWKDIATDTNYVQSHGDDLYRRSLYTYWKRTVAPPVMVTLDATSREACTVKRSRTNTPLQALAAMNEVGFVEASRALAQRTMIRPRLRRDAQRLTYMFRAATARRPTDSEIKILNGALEHWRTHYGDTPEDAKRLIQVGEHPVGRLLEPAPRASQESPALAARRVELAAMTMVASLIMNMDEVFNLE